MNNGKAVVLVVEDSPIVRMGAVEMVLARGYQALEASDAEAAIGILEGREDVDLVFTDVQMPGTMDGIWLAHCIRERWPPVKLILVSANAIVEEDTLPAGSRYFAKPYDEDTIAEAMKRLLTKND